MQLGVFWRKNMRKNIGHKNRGTHPFSKPLSYFVSLSDVAVDLIYLIRTLCVTLFLICWHRRHRCFCLNSLNVDSVTRVHLTAWCISSIGWNTSIVLKEQNEADGDCTSIVKNATQHMFEFWMIWFLKIFQIWYGHCVWLQLYTWIFVYYWGYLPRDGNCL